MALGIGCLVLLVIGIAVIRGIYIAAKNVIAQAPKTGTTAPLPATPPVGTTDTPPPDSTPPTDSTPASGGSDEDNAQALSAHMNKFGECLQRFGTINSHPRMSDPDWRQEMEQNTQEMKTIIGEERQLTWPSSLLPAKENYEGGLAEYEYLADHWPAAVENGDLAELTVCQQHAEKAKTLVLQAESQIKQVVGG